MDPDARIAELTAELAEAKEKIERLRAVEDENRSLKDRVHDLHSELVTLSPPKLPHFSSGPEAAATPSQVARVKRSQLLTWTTLALVLIGALVAALPYLLTYIHENNRADGQFTDERGIGSSTE